MNVDLLYGKGFVTLRIPDENISEIIRPWQNKGKADSEAVLSQALVCPEKNDFQKKLAGKPDELIETMHLHPAHQPQKVVDNWLAEDPNAKITIVDGANKIALYPKTQVPFT